MKIPRLTAESSIGPSLHTYAVAAPAVKGGPLAAMGTLHLAADQEESAARGLARISNPGLNPCNPGQSVCWGTGLHVNDYACCDPDEECAAPAADGTPGCAPRLVTHTISLSSDNNNPLAARA